jgi:SAM-dependent methyltransferase
VARGARLDWWSTYFDDDYLVEHGSMFTPERTRAEAARALVLFGLPAGARLLDCPSGQGRHARLFAEAGLDVTALDYSARLLAAARHGGVAAGLRFVRGDSRRLPASWTGRFDAVASLGASFGFFATPAEDEAGIAGFARVLAPDGVLLLHATNRDGVVSGFIEKDWWNAEDGTLVLYEREFDPLSAMLTVHVVLRRASAIRRRAYRLRLYTASELAAMCARHGLIVTEAYDGWRNRPLRRRSGEMLLRAQRG